MMHLGLMSVDPDVSRSTSFPDCKFLDLPCLVFSSCLSNVLEVIGPLSNQAKGFFKIQQNTNKPSKSWNKTRLCFVGIFVTLGILGLIK
jgi:hypothetical protein